MERIHAVCKVKATFFKHYAASQPFVALSQQKKEKSNDFQPKFAVLCEFLSVLVLQVGVIQDNAGFAESLLCLPFVLFFLFVVVFFFLVTSCKTCYCVAHVLPRNPIGFVMKKKTSSEEYRFDRQGGVTSLEVVSGEVGRGLHCLLVFSL